MKKLGDNIFNVIMVVCVCILWCALLRYAFYGAVSIALIALAVLLIEKLFDFIDKVYK